MHCYIAKAPTNRSRGRQSGRRPRRGRSSVL